MRFLGTIQGRLVGLAIGVALGVLALSALAALQASLAERQLLTMRNAHSAVAIHAAADDLHDVVRGDVYALILAPTTEAQSRVRSELSTHVAELLERLAKAGELARADPEVAEPLDRASEALTRYANAATEMAELLAVDRLSAITQLASFLDLYRAAQADGEKARLQLSSRANDIQRKSERAARISTRAVMAGTFILGLVGLAVGWPLVRRVRAALNLLEHRIHRVTGGDLTSDGFETGHDELGELADALETMTTSLREMIDSVQEGALGVDRGADGVGERSAAVRQACAQQMQDVVGASERMKEATSHGKELASGSIELGESADDAASAQAQFLATHAELNELAEALSNSVDESSGSVRELASTVTQIAGSAVELATIGEQALESVSDVAAASQQVSGSASQAHALAERVRETASEGQQGVRQTIEGMSKIREAGHRAHESVRGLEQRVSEIDQVTEMIDDISDETNLLALNAAIIAAQAGVHGRAFGVVADEIGALAARASESTLRIRQLIADVRDGTAKTASQMEQSYSVAEVEGERSRATAAAWEKITEAARDNSVRVSEISSAAKLQSERCATAEELMQKLSFGTSEIRCATEQHQAGTRPILEQFERMVEMVGDVRRRGKEQAQGSARLGEMSESVRNVAGAVGESVRHQGDVLGNARELFEAVGQRARDNEHSTERLDDEARALRKHSRALLESVARFHAG